MCHLLKLFEPGQRTKLLQQDVVWFDLRLLKVEVELLHLLPLHQHHDHHPQESRMSFALI